MSEGEIYAMISRLKRNLRVPTIEVAIITSKPLIFENAVGIRGYLAGQFPEERLFHNHTQAGLVYSYPRIQYKVLNGCAWIICLAEGIAAVEKLKHLDNIRLGSEMVQVKDIQIESKETILGVSDYAITYSFVTPWLALNEANHRKYLKCRPEDRKYMLANILESNLISVSKGLGYTVPKPIKAKMKVREVATTLKNIPMIGFLGTFSVNFEIPNLWGLGKSVSRGFGTVIRITDKNGSNLITDN